MISTSNQRRKFVVASSLAVFAPMLSASMPAVAAESERTKKVLDHHLGAFAKGLDEIMLDYTDLSIILAGGAKFSGLKEIRGFFDGFLKGVKPGFWEAFKLNSKVVEKDVAYIVWEAKPFVTLATDTVVVRKGKIHIQTFTSA